MTFLVVAAQAADLLTALNMPPGYVEGNPIASAVMASLGAAVAIKLALALLVVSIVVIVRRIDPRISRIVASFAIAAGLVGAWSNGGFA